MLASLKDVGSKVPRVVVMVVQSQRVDTASAALQAERAERASLADRLAVVVRERDGVRHDLDALRAELAAHVSSHDTEIQVRATNAWTAELFLHVCLLGVCGMHCALDAALSCNFAGRLK